MSLRLQNFRDRLHEEYFNNLYEQNVYLQQSEFQGQEAEREREREKGSGLCEVHTHEVAATAEFRSVLNILYS